MRRRGQAGSQLPVPSFPNGDAATRRERKAGTAQFPVPESGSESYGGGVSAICPGSRSVPRVMSQNWEARRAGRPQPSAVSMQEYSHAEPRSARRERPVTNSSTSATIHPTVTDPLPIQVSFLRASASPREPVPAFFRMVTAQRQPWDRALNGNSPGRGDRTSTSRSPSCPSCHPVYTSPPILSILSPPQNAE